MIIAYPQTGLTVGSLTVFTSLVLTIAARVRELSVVISQFQQFGVSVHKVTDLYDSVRTLTTAGRLRVQWARSER